MQRTTILPVNITLSEEDAVAGTNRVRLLKADQTKDDRRWFDKMRNLVQVHEYLCHIGEAIEWIESFLNEKIDNNDDREASIVQLEQTLHDGVVLAKLARRIHPGIIHSITPGDAKFKFLRSNNINAFLTVLKEVGLPSIFWFEFVDLYDGKNMPKVIYCIHALSHLLHSNDSAPKIKNLEGKFNFSDDVLIATQRNLEKSGATMPNFSNLGSSLQKELDGGRKKPVYSFKKIEEPLLSNHDTESKVPRFNKAAPIVTDLYDSDTESRTSSSDELESPSIPTMQRLQFLDAAADSSISSSDSEIEYYEDDISGSEYDDTEERIEALEQHFTKPENERVLVNTQGCIRAFMARNKLQKIKDQYRYQSFQSTVQKMQARIRTASMRRQLGEKRREFFSCPEDWVTALQAMIRRYLAMKQLGEEHHQIQMHHMQTGRLRTEGKFTAQYHERAYQKLKSEKNPSIGVVKSVLHMLSNNDVDFNEDLIIEELRQKVVESIRDNNQLDSQVSMIDIQIALLLKNAVTLDEVVKLSNAFFNPNRKKQQQQRFSELLSSNPSNSPYDLRGVDKSNRDKLELYQQLVFLLQTEPIYLARLMSIAGGQVHGEKKGQRKIDATVLALFGYGTNAREECLLINLCKASIVQEMKHVKSPQEFMRGNYTFMKLVVQVNRGAKEREFFSTLFQNLLDKVLNNNELDLETNPMVIYQKCISQEESATGQPSNRPFNINQAQALQSPDVLQILSEHLEMLRNITEEFLNAIINALDVMPYGMRVIARELRLVMEDNFPEVSPEEINKILGNFVYYRYLSPVITAPEQHIAIHHEISSLQRRNLAEISKMLQHISNGKDFDARNIQLGALNGYIKSSTQRFTQWFMDLTDVEDPEQHFGMDQLSDYTNTQKPTVYVHPTELYHIHQLLQENVDFIERQNNGILHSILSDLGEAPSNANMSVPLHVLRLELNDRRDGIPSEAGGDVKKLLLDTKRLVILVIQVQSGPSLEAIFEEPVTSEHEAIWEVVREEAFPSEGTEQEIEMAIRERNFKFGYQNAAMDVKKLSFAKLKSFASSLHNHLMKHGIIPESPGYQSIINMIAVDITKKGERRKLRNTEIKKLQNILQHLDEKKQFLISQGTSYKEYLDGCMKNMAERRGKKQKFVFPFTRQYFHMKNLQRRNLVPKFGSYKYSAKTLYDRGIILDLAGVSKKLYARITIILSMDRAGIITFEGYFPLLNTQDLHVDVQYEDLLQTQYEGVQTMKVLDGMATVNVNLLIYLINKKFYHTA
ncbi:iqgap-related protein [Mucor circinelloides]